MQWTLRITVVLLNIAWVAFFLQPHPFSMFVQRRDTDSTDEEMHFGEFCIQPQSKMNWTSNLHPVNITSNKTINMTSEVFSPTAPRDLSKDEVTPSSPPLLGQTSSEVTTAFGLVVNSSNSGTTPVTTTHQSKAPAVQPNGNQTNKVISMFVQRRDTDSTDEEMQFGEFCIRPQSKMNWTSNLHPVNITSNKTINMTSEESAGSNHTLIEINLKDKEDQNNTDHQQNCQCNNTNIQEKDWSQLIDINFRPPAPGCEPTIIMKFPDMEVCIDVTTFSATASCLLSKDEVTPSSPPVKTTDQSNASVQPNGYRSGGGLSK
ncbi:uncharacterized protein LOC122973332 [Scomber scombrus]|uniref:Uncharacterized protein LOC122973332 n=1 Tax=Scomber scombrus TaxID=13677 RepID=A0AAV1P0N6_SCOSC